MNGQVPAPGADEPPREQYGKGSPFRPAKPAPLLERTVPLSEELPRYRPHTARRDLVAGLTVAALAVPAAMAYAELAGLSPVHGLYALLLPTLLYVVLGSSKTLIIGPEGSLSALVAAALLPLAAAGSSAAAELAAVLALLVAVCFLIAWLLRLGWIADYLSRPVLIGYISGVAVVLVMAQLGKLFGLDIENRDPIPQLGEVARELGSVSGTTIAVGAVSLALLFALKFLAPRFPASLVVVVGAIAASWALDLESHGVAVVGTIPSGLPSVQFPRPPLLDVVRLLPAALGIFVLCFADEILTARSFAGKRGQHVRVTQEMLAMGAADAAAGLTQGFPVGASNSRTAVNDAMGARTQIAALVAGVTVVLILLFLTDPIAYLPKAVLGAVIVSAAVGLVDLAAWRSLRATDPVELAIAGVTTVGVLTIGVLEAISLAVALAIVDVVRRSARPHDAVLGWVEQLGRYGDVAVHKSARVTPGVVVYRLDDRLFFANARYVKGRIREAIHGAPPPVRWLVFDAEALSFVDATGLAALAELEQELAEDEVALAFARLKSEPKAQFDEDGLTTSIGSERFFPTVRAAVDACAAADSGGS